MGHSFSHARVAMQSGPLSFAHYAGMRRLHARQFDLYSRQAGFFRPGGGPW